MKHAAAYAAFLSAQSKKKVCLKCAKEYKTASGLWKHEKTCAQGLRALIVEQQKKQDELLAHLQAQQKQLAELAPTFTTHHHHNHNHNTNVLVFLNQECGSALNWSEFVAGLTVTLEGDVTDSVVKTLCTGFKNLGLHKRPLHCVDEKRRKLYLKTNDIWEYDAEKIRIALRESTETLQMQCRLTLQSWGTTHPGWHDNETEIETYRKLAVQITEGIDEERCTMEISKTVNI